ncbi:[FeFe] hydrogenase H-cluster radical SAM maturase HydE [Desulfotruncus alcoholivorax]|uniref:[FeFe] hydrogenase H-cluster radical SAM maturase HydE n=1 Tax=Desulfotruncus alcoholivorax TaxID=265477 RepID=UPI00041FDCD0|nr:[FeFe] hydrogenase H-cluster radical SAM maturase HydE [Desulfotruncus alcoholivorax]
MHNFKNALAKAKSGEMLNRQEICALLAAGPEESEELFGAADRVRHDHVGDEVHLRAIIEFSNYCRKNCLYCGLRRDNHSIPRYRLTEQEILEAVKKARELGFRTVVLQSGEDLYYDAKTIAKLVETIKNRHDLAVTLSLGERSREDYLAWREAGADRYLLKQETADEHLFSIIKPDGNMQQRVQCLQWLKDLGYQTGSGNMVGLPGQTLATLAEDIILMRKLDVEMAGIGPFLPHPATPLKAAAPGSPALTLKTLAVTRLCLPQAHLPATTSLCTLTPDGRKLALNCGANVIMPNLTPAGVRDKYLIYPQKADIIEKPEAALNNIQALLTELARPPAQDYGHAKKPPGRSF